MSILLFLAVLFVLVLVHEWGHFITAKKTGMRVDEFAIGFPPKLFGVKKGETEYNFNLLPIGGYVKIFGENAEEAASDQDKKDVSRAFGSRPKWAQAVVLLAGITMNILFAWFLFTITLMVGVPTAVDEADASPSAEMYVAGTLPNSPADGVLPAGSVIVAAESDGDILKTVTPSAFSTFVTEHAPQPVVVTYELDGTASTVELVPQKGLVANEAERYIVGTSLSLVETRKEGPVSAVLHGAKMTVEGIVSITVGLYTLIKDAVVGQADLTNIAGPVGIVSMVGDAAAFGIVPLLTFTAIISLNLAVVNLLPFPALDGGRLVFVIIEAVTRKQVPPQWTGYINLVGFVLLLVIMAAVTFNDVTRLMN
jgi:regulator of sigma E protease